MQRSLQSRPHVFASRVVDWHSKCFCPVLGGPNFTIVKDIAMSPNAGTSPSDNRSFNKYAFSPCLEQVATSGVTFNDPAAGLSVCMASDPAPVRGGRPVGRDGFARGRVAHKSNRTIRSVNQESPLQRVGETAVKEDSQKHRPNVLLKSVCDVRRGIYNDVWLYHRKFTGRST
jgi:hypothetical protein